MNWDDYFYKLATTVAGKSKDPATRVGAVAVGVDNQILSTGFNGLPRRVVDKPTRLERPEKYLWVVHAESNCIAHAARTGMALKGAVLYTTHYPCASCAGLIIQAGIKEVVYGTGQTSLPQSEYRRAETMLQEALVNTRIYKTESAYDTDVEKTGG